MTDQEVGGHELLVHQLKLEKSRAGSSEIRTVEEILHEKKREEKFGQGMERYTSRSHWSSCGRLPEAFEEVH